MSRIGRLPISVPAGVEVKVDGNLVTVKGRKGRALPQGCFPHHCRSERQRDRRCLVPTTSACLARCTV